MACYDNIPQELKDLKQWVCAVSNKKVPMKAWEYAPASSTAPGTWSDFNKALNAVKRNRYSDIGFVLADNGYVAIDIDKGYDEEELPSTMAVDIMSRCQSYTEKSRSGRGFHILLRGQLPFKGKNNLQGVEIYKTSRYIIMTGDTLVYKTIADNQAAIDYVLSTYFKDSRECKSRKEQDKIYKPLWINPIKDRRIKTRPQYPDIPKGCRNICLTSLAGSLHNLGYTKTQIFKELSYVNKTSCSMPLTDGELQNICVSVSKYKR